MVDLKQNFLEECTKYFNEEQRAFLESVFDFAYKVHNGQLRDSGEPYITHPVAVAKILMQTGLDTATVAAALLHDCVEDTEVTEQDLKEKFGDEITELVMGVTKLDKIIFKSREEAQAENFRRMYLAMAKDIRVILIKIADRLHNMRTISSKPADRQVAIANETLDIYAPLASRLGLSYFKCELEDMCLKILQPDVYQELMRDLTLKRAERQDLVVRLCMQLEQIIKDLGIKGEVSGRPKHFYSIYKKMVEKNKSFDQIYDLTAVRVIVETTKDCYEVLGMIHTKWKPIPGRFKDYIAVPKPNNYQSLHTTVMTSYGMPFEIQIRTYEMHKIAEYGIAAHWMYKEHRNDKGEFNDKLQWLRGVMDVKSENENPQEFYESLKVDLHSGQIFVFTPKGDVVPLAEGSTPVDFAYYVHSEVGNQCVGAKVNNKIVPLETKLVTGDYIEIITSKNSKGPSRDWLRFVKTAQAKSKIRAFYKKELKEDNIKRGKEMLEHEAHNRGYNWSDLIRKEWLDVIMERYSLSSINDMYASVGYGSYTVNQILLKLIDMYRKSIELTDPTAAIKRSGKKTDKTGISIKGYENDDILIRTAKCCNPVPGDEIIGYISRGRGVAVHRANCPNLKSIEKFRLIEAKWLGGEGNTFVVSLQVETKNTAGILAKITVIVSELNMSIDNLNARVDKHNNGIININVNITDTAQIDKLINKISEIEGVDKVFRSTSL